MKILSLQKFNVTFSAVILHQSHAFQLTIGDCPVYFEEPCDSKVIRFTLITGAYSRRISPYYPAFPRDTSISAPVKILVHGYGGLTIDYAIRNVSAAYRRVGYHTIIGIWKIPQLETQQRLLSSSWLVVSISVALLRHSFPEYMARGSVHSGFGCCFGTSRGQTGGIAHNWLQLGRSHSRLRRQSFPTASWNSYQTDNRFARRILIDELDDFSESIVVCVVFSVSSTICF